MHPNVDHLLRLAAKSEPTPAQAEKARRLAAEAERRGMPMSVAADLQAETGQTATTETAENEPAPSDAAQLADAGANGQPRRRQGRKATSPVPEIVRVDQRTEMAAAQRFVALHGEDVRYVAPWNKWLVWDGTRWQVDELCQIEKLAKEAARLLWDEIVPELLTTDRQTATALTSFGRTISSANGIAHMLSLARSEPDIAVMPEALDSHPWLLNCLNGTVDLRTGELLSHHRSQLLTKIVPHDYLQGAEAECPLWEQTLDQIFAENQDVLGFFRRLCGSALAGEVVDHILPILWGGGQNGKSLIVETLIAVLGDDFALKGADELLLASDGERHPTEKADLFGKRLVVCNEIDDGRRLAESTVKSLTGGDTISARRMREDFWRFRPSHTIFLATNHKPIVQGTDDGIWRRLRLIPFTRKFWDAGKGETGPPELRADTQLGKRLTPELPGILSWLVRACLEWQRDGLGQPAEVTLATTAYKNAMNTFHAFLQDRCVIDPESRCRASDLAESYRGWCKTHSEEPVGGRRLVEMLEEIGIHRKRSNGSWYVGLGITTETSKMDSWTDWTPFPG